MIVRFSNCVFNGATGSRPTFECEHSLHTFLIAESWHYETVLAWCLVTVQEISRCSRFGAVTAASFSATGPLVKSKLLFKLFGNKHLRSPRHLTRVIRRAKLSASPAGTKWPLPPTHTVRPGPLHPVSIGKNQPARRQPHFTGHKLPCNSATRERRRSVLNSLLLPGKAPLKCHVEPTFPITTHVAPSWWLLTQQLSLELQ